MVEPNLHKIPVNDDQSKFRKKTDIVKGKMIVEFFKENVPPLFHFFGEIDSRDIRVVRSEAFTNLVGARHKEKAKEAMKDDSSRNKPK